MTIINALPNTLTNGTTADATQVMANFNQIVSNANANAAHSGANSDITSLSSLATPLSGAQGGTLLFIGGTSTNTANAQVVATTTPNSFTLTTGNRVAFLAGFTNTGATTLNVASTGATNVFRRTSGGAVALTGGEIVLGQEYTAAFDGTQYELLDPAPGQFINAQSGTTYALVGGDNGRLVTLTNAGAIAVSLAQASNAGSFPTGWWTELTCLSSSVGSVTITPTTSTINGAATLLVNPGDSVKIFSDGTNYQISRGTPVVTSIANTLSGDVTLNNIGTFFDGPSVAQGTVGTWFASGTVTLIDTAGSAQFQVKLWDGTTVIASAQAISSAINVVVPVSVSGVLASPAANIRISVKDISSTSGLIKFNASGSSKDSTVTALRIG